MAILHVEKFGKYAAFADISDNVNAVAVGSTGVSFSNNGRFGDRALNFSQHSSGTHADFAINAVTAATELTVLINFFAGVDLDTSSNPLLALRGTGIADIHWQLSMGMNGAIFLRGAGITGFAQYLITGAIVPQAWNTLEVQINAVDSGTAIIRVNGNEVLNVSGVDFYNASYVRTWLSVYGLNDTSIVDEFIIMDDSGATFNDFIGDFRIDVDVPAADATPVDWTLNTGSDDYAAVDDALGAYDDASTYLESTSAAEDSFMDHGAAANAGIITTVLFCALCSRVVDTGAAPEQFTHVVDSGGTVATGATHAPDSTNYWFFTDVFEVDPDTTSAWGTTGIQNAKWGVRSIT